MVYLKYSAKRIWRSGQGVETRVSRSCVPSPGDTGNYFAMRYRSVSKAVKHTGVAALNIVPDIYYLIGCRKGIRL